MRDRTTLVIARRKETLEKVDRIIVIEKNRIIETGCHQKLLSEKGLYTKLYPLYH
jgi:ABC-type multidrug transport system fused ATPase/permease subunit